MKEIFMLLQAFQKIFIDFMMDYHAEMDLNILQKVPILVALNFGDLQVNLKIQLVTGLFMDLLNKINSWMRIKWFGMNLFFKIIQYKNLEDQELMNKIKKLIKKVKNHIHFLKEILKDQPNYYKTFKKEMKMIYKKRLY